ncbi:glucose-dependent insulinotropic receptor-like [Saccoglossus kowalevskii]
MGNYFDQPVPGQNGSNSTNVCQDDSSATQLTVHHSITLVILIVEVVLIFIGNVLVLVSVCINKVYLKSTYIFMVSLCVADLFLGLVIVTSLIRSMVDPDSFLWCIVSISLIIMSCSASIYSILLIAYDRYIAITKPLNYVKNMTQTKEILLIIAIWSWSFFLGFIPTLGSQNVDYTCGCSAPSILRPSFPFVLIIVGFLPPLIILVYFYSRIYSVSFKHSRQIADLERSIQDINHMKFARELKAAKTLAIVFGCFLLTWLPFFIVLSVEVICKEHCDLAIILNYLLLLGFSNSALNPWVYVYWNQETRKKLCFKCRRNLVRMRNRASVASECSITSMSHRRSAVSTQPSYLDDNLYS